MGLCPPCAGFALGAPGAGGWHPYTVTAGDTQPPRGNGAVGGQPAAPRLRWGSREKEAGYGKRLHKNIPKESQA